MESVHPSPGAVKLRLACLSSFTFEPIVAALGLQLRRAGFDAETYVAPFGQFDAELIGPDSELTRFGPNAVLVAIRLQDVCPAIYESFNATRPDAARGLLNDWRERLRAALSAFRSRSDAHLLIQNYDLPAAPAGGIADGGAENSQGALIQAANDDLAEIARGLENTYVLDYDALVARVGREAWTDRRMALYARAPVAPQHYWRLAGFYVRHLRPLYGLTKKVLVLDADNTLWGGAVGDLGVDGIALGPDYPGSAYVAFQRRVLDLYHRGVVLCIASKNEPGAVERVLDEHPEMVLHREHFAALRVNWEPKPQNFQALAATLNLGLDSFVFVDDSPVECELMRAALPQVTTIRLPAEPALFAEVIERVDCFDQWTVSEEDRRRGELYRSEAGRRELETAAVDMPMFYRQLQMKIAIGVDVPAQVARASQMTNRTNQFNMHTIRCTPDDIRRFVDAADYHLVTLALADRYGDSGVVGLAVVRKAERDWVLHMLLMSCRVLGRTVENAFVAWIAGEARAGGATALVAEFVATPKNKPFAGFYESVGFHRDSSGGDVERWVLPLDDAHCTIPDWFDVSVERGSEPRR
jgi:FkbH-like protein